MCVKDKRDVIHPVLASPIHQKVLECGPPIALCGKGQETPILDTSGEKFSWIRFTFLEVVLHRASVRDLGAWSNQEINCFPGISVSLVLGWGLDNRWALKIRKNNSPMGLENTCLAYLPSFRTISLFIWKIWPFPGMPARFLTKLASNQGILWVNPLQSGVTFTSGKIKGKLYGVIYKIETMGSNPNCCGHTNFPQCAVHTALHCTALHWRSQ